jgi:ribonuclease HII
MALIIGIDEAGRGPIAGPVSVGAVAFREDYDVLAVFPGLNDSKKLTEKKREVLFEILEKEAQKGNVKFHVAFSTAKMIDEKGIVPAVSHALEEALRSVFPEPLDSEGLPYGKVFLDGALRAPSEYFQETVIGGDGIIPAIMLASVAAKVVRDRHMTREIASLFPAYFFEKHKGYGTSAHYAAITKHGLCIEHRRSFLKSVLSEKK